MMVSAAIKKENKFDASCTCQRGTEGNKHLQINTTFQKQLYMENIYIYGMMRMILTITLKEHQHSSRFLGVQVFRFPLFKDSVARWVN